MVEKWSNAAAPEDASDSPSPARKPSSKLTLPTGDERSYEAALQARTYTLGSAERLKRSTLLESLFTDGKTISITGYTIVYRITPLDTFYPAQVAFTVPKRKFALSPHRARIKRMMREAYRHYKPDLYERLSSNGLQVAIMLICRADTLPDSSQVQVAVTTLLDKLMAKVGKK